MKKNNGDFGERQNFRWAKLEKGKTILEQKANKASTLNKGVCAKVKSDVLSTRCIWMRIWRFQSNRENSGRKFILVLIFLFVYTFYLQTSCNYDIIYYKDHFKRFTINITSIQIFLF